MGSARNLNLQRKTKRTFSLSRDSVKYLEALRKKRGAKSVSSVLEDVIREQQQAKELERVSASVTNYYDSLSDEGQAENLAWGEFASRNFPD